MKATKENVRLYLVTDRTWVGEKNLDEQILESIKSGVTFVQLREKNLNKQEFIQEAKRIKRITDEYKIPFIINDNIEVAMEVDADGVHVGQSDLNAMDCRKKIGKDKILGVSTKTVEQALYAQKCGADYLGVGAIFSTSTKKDATTISIDTLKEICQAVDIPVVAIGGLSEYNVLELKGSGIDGIAVISAILASNNITEAAKKMRSLADEVVI